MVLTADRACTLHAVYVVALVGVGRGRAPWAPLGPQEAQGGPNGAQGGRPGGMRGPRGGGRAKKKGRELNRYLSSDTPIAPPNGGLADLIASRIPPGQGWRGKGKME